MRFWQAGCLLSKLRYGPVQDRPIWGGTTEGHMRRNGGHNRSEHTRSAFSHQYCEPWARQQENYFLSVPRERAAKMPRRLRELLGYSIHPPFMGQVAGRHPQKVLAPGYRNSLLVDDE